MRYSAGKPARLPSRVMFHIIAARYGQTPDQVRTWAADDFMDACNFLGVTHVGQ